MRKFFLTLSILMAAVAQASAKETLTVYTYEGFVSDWGAGPHIKRAFEAECDCTLEWVGVQDGVAILTRLKLEGKSTKSDVALGLDQNLIAEAKETGLFAPHEIEAEGLQVPVEWNDEVFLPYDYGHFAVVYDREQVPNPPKSLEELISGDPSQKIAIQDPRTSTPGLGLLLWIKMVYGDEAADAWARFRPRILTVTPGWSESYSLFTKGEVPMVLSYSTSPAYHMIEEKTERYAAAVFPEGHYIQIEVAGRLASSDNPELAKRFLEFMVGPGFQNIIPTTNWMLPAGKTTEPLAPEFGKLDLPEKTLMLPPEVVAENRRAWTDEWLGAMSE